MKKNQKFGNCFPHMFKLFSADQKSFIISSLISEMGILKERIGWSENGMARSTRRLASLKCVYVLGDSIKIKREKIYWGLGT